MDVHRCRFVEYTPAAINAVAFSHPHSALDKDETNEDLRLAVGRANGDIEIWNPSSGHWFQETIFKGGKDRTIEGLVWTRDTIEDEEGRTNLKLRLFSIGYSSEITEWDLASGTPLALADSNYGGVWCIAAQPAAQDGTSQNLAVGCDDGTVAVLYTGDDEFRFGKAMSRPSNRKARVLSITYQGRDTIVAGYSDSTIRIFNATTGQILRNMSVGISSTNGPKDVLVWAVAALPNGNIVSGDSTGELKFWDGKTWTLSQRLKVHKADTLCLAVSADGRSVFSGGMDRRTAVSRLSNVKGDVLKRWSVALHRKFHSNDVKAMALVENGDLRAIATGGPDTILSILPIDNFGQNYKKLTNLPQRPPLSSSSSKKLLVSWSDQELRIWRFARDEASLGSPPLVAKILLNSEESVTSACISPDGSMLAVATAADTKIFQLTAQGNALGVRKAAIGKRKGAKLVAFSPDSQWLLIVHTDNKVALLQLDASDDVNVSQSSVLSRASRSSNQLQKGISSELSDYKRNIFHASFSGDSRILAVCDLEGYIDVWQLDDTEWLHQESSLDLPKLPQSPAIFTFQPQSDAASDKLFVITQEHEIYELQVLEGTLSEWSKENQPATLPAKFKNLRSRVVGAIWDSQNSSRIWLYGSSWVFMVNLATSGGLAESFEAIEEPKSNKRRRDSLANEANGIPKNVLQALDNLNQARDLSKPEELMDVDGEESEVNGVESHSTNNHKPKRSRTDSIFPGAGGDTSSDENEDTTKTSGLAGTGDVLSDAAKADDAGLAASDSAVVLARPSRAGWFTTRYQHILGIVPIGERDSNDSSQSGPEVAIVERPPWDLNLPARFQENHDYPKV